MTVEIIHEIRRYVTAKSFPDSDTYNSLSVENVIRLSHLFEEFLSDFPTKKLRFLDLSILALAMYLSDDSHKAMDLPDRTSVDVCRLSILAHQ